MDVRQSSLGGVSNNPSLSRSVSLEAQSKTEVWGRSIKPSLKQRILKAPEFMVSGAKRFSERVTYPVREFVTEVLVETASSFWNALNQSTSSSYLSCVKALKPMGLKPQREHKIRTVVLDIYQFSGAIKGGVKALPLGTFSAIRKVFKEGLQYDPARQCHTRNRVRDSWDAGADRFDESIRQIERDNLCGVLWHDRKLAAQKN
ncbi:hypothetical protein [Parendozoicomonas haliclonae]|uniref:Uncharacterized protein n=1 Tax=Parendozoicomonas haliclonae TaxID=1960125 RepID=A0A1X7AKS1_9GAMM|nr:hypothetical protein [Parendozoicomonas haliclonae]SMA47587.1 hypothetical protein EHSB41UT_02482 [Parendozoicomonas haliclonae]